MQAHKRLTSRTDPRGRPKRSISTLQNVLRATVRYRKFVAALTWCGLGYGVWQYGTSSTFQQGVNKFYQDICSRYGFVVDDIIIEGNVHTQDDEINSRLQLAVGDPIFKCDPHGVKAKLEDIPWVKTAAVQRRLPGVIQVKLVERTPVALWQYEGQLSLIDEDGIVMPQQDIKEFRNLVVVVGKGAPAKTGRILSEIVDLGNVLDNVAAVVFVNERRWDLVLKNGVKIKLPEENVGSAIEHLVELNQSYNILSGAVKIVDLRLQDRTFLRTEPAQAAG